MELGLQFVQLMNGTDNYKLRILIEQAIKCLQFLDLIKVQHDISSELAGFEISKLLKDQENNELKYAELVKRRTGLTGITHKKELEEVEVEITTIAGILKESTKKLCKLFKENPNPEKDSLKVIRERKSLIAKMSELSTMGFIQTNATQKFQTFITSELESQDQLRRFMERQKNLNMDIKKLQQQKNLEFKEYQKQIQQNLAKIREQKEKLMEKTQRAELKIKYSQKQHDAEISNLKRMNKYAQELLKNELDNLQKKIAIQTAVHKELRDFLLRKEQQIKKKSEDWVSKSENTKQQLDREISRLTQLKEKTVNELAEYKQKYELQEKRKMERELQQKNKALDKQNKQYQRIQIENSIRLIQQEYLAWKEAGGGKKKKKKRG